MFGDNKAAHFMVARKEREIEEGSESQYLLQGHARNNLTSFYQALSPEGSITFQSSQAGDPPFNIGDFEEQVIAGTIFNILPPMLTDYPNQ
jgi:hypothetical protein